MRRLTLSAIHFKSRMKYNPLKPDEKRPWCEKCRAHTAYTQFPGSEPGDPPSLKCNRCEGQLLNCVYGMTHSSRLGCIVPAWWVLGVLLLIVGVLLFVTYFTDSPQREEGMHLVAGFFLTCAAGSFAMAIWLSSLKGSWESWVKEQGRKTDEELEEEAKQWHRNLPAKKKKKTKKKRRYESKRKQVRQNIIVGAILAAAGQWWLTSAGVEDPWSYAPGVLLGIYILFAYNFTTME